MKATVWWTGVWVWGIAMVGHGMAEESPAARAQSFLAFYNATYQRLYQVAQEAQWLAATDVRPEHTGRRIGADAALAAFVGSPWVIEQCRALESASGAQDELTRRQLRVIALMAAEVPGTQPDLVRERVAAEARQSAILDGFEFRWTPPGSTSPQRLTANQIDDLLLTSTNLAERRAVWEASKQSGVALKEGLLQLRDLRNRLAREMGYSSYYALRAAHFGLTVPELRALLERLVAETRPLYEQLHAWARRRLAQRYGQPVPRLIPAHWLPNRWGQEWPGLVEGLDLDPMFRDRSAEWIVRQAVAYGESLGLPRVPDTFWTRSDLYDLPPESPRKKNTHASAWDMDLNGDVRSLMNVKPSFGWFATAHHEMGHVFYFLAYHRPEVPYVLRRGASPAMHEAMAETLATPTVQPPYLKRLGLWPDGVAADDLRWLLNAALDQVVFIPWAAGVMASWEHDFYEENLPADELNRRWWMYVERYQGIAPPEPRGEEFCDPATKTHINDDPAEYYKYALAFLTKYQFHLYLARQLGQDPRQSDFYGRREVGAFLMRIMQAGATRDWRSLIRDATGEDLSARPMLEYYAPLFEYLRRENEGQPVGW
ncbi:M2 family metallopeptidase [Limisphaera sp. VF-2]|jgi:peptidyl-dipeptidase A|uniref:M2 family metallopeptidase n=1 Tax=Limisphaera sp. VF-2 TaxID=3400418 RepID=UPI001757D891|nr:M2 family metallopeptidase [Limisphaera sp.]